MLQIESPAAVMARINVSVSASGAADNCRAALRAFKKWWVEKLRVNGVPEPELSVKYIMDHVVTHVSLHYAVCPFDKYVKLCA